MILLLSPYPSPPPYPSSKLDGLHTGRFRNRDNLLTGKGGGGKIIRRMESLVLYNAVNTLCLNHFQPVIPNPLFVSALHTPTPDRNLYERWSLFIFCPGEDHSHVSTISYRVETEKFPTFSRKKIKKIKISLNNWRKNSQHLDSFSK
jgi:hypothetical protein